MLDINLNINFYDSIAQNPNIIFDFSLTMLAIQATVSVLNLTLFNFILQMKQTNIYGYNYSQFIFENISLGNGKIKSVKVKNSLAIALLFIIVNAVLLFLAAYFDITWFYIGFYIIFPLTFYMIWKLSSTIFALVIDQDKFETEVKNHLQNKLISHIDEDNKSSIPEEIRNIKDSCFENIDKGEIDNAQNEAEFVLELLCDLSLYEDSEELISKFNKLILEIAVKFLETDYLEQGQQTVIDYLVLLEKLDIELTKNYALLNDFYLKLNGKLKFKDLNEIYELNPFNLISKIYKVYGFEAVEKIDLLHLFTLTVSTNEELDSKDKSDLLKEIYRAISVIDKEDFNEIQADLSILKTSLDNLPLNEIDVFASILNEILNSSSREVNDYIHLVLEVYFYFLLYFKKDLRKEYKEKIREIKNGTYIEDSSSQSTTEFEFLKKIEPFVKAFKFYPFVSKILRQSKWEKVPVINFKKRAFHKKKLPDITRKFFIYYMFQMTEMGYKNQKEVFMKNISLHELSKVLNEIYNVDGTIKKVAFNEYRNFLDLYGLKIKDCTELRIKSREFFEFLKNIYKKKFLIQQKIYDQNKIDNSKEQLKHHLKEEIINDSLYKISDCSKAYELEKNYKSKNIGKITADLLSGSYDLEDYAVNLKNIFISRLIDKLRRKFDELENSSINIESVEDNLSIFYKKIAKYNIDTVLCSENIENYLKKKKFEDRDYDNLIEDAQKIDISRNFNFYIDSENLDFCIKNLSVEIESCSDEYIKREYEKHQGIFAGDVLIEMSEEKFFEYMKNRNYDIFVSYDFYIDLKDGAGFYLGY